MTRTIAAPLHPNLGTGAEYRRRLEDLIDQMNSSLLYWLVARWRAAPPRTIEIAADEAPVSALRRSMRVLAKRWQNKFDEAAPRLGEYFATEARKRVDGRMAKILDDAGMTVKFRYTGAMRDAFGAVVGENVGLISSIAQRHLSDVEGIVLRSVAAGHDLSTMARDLEERFDVPRNRAALIARDQNAKATAVLTRVRQRESGIRRAVWLHSGGGREPRPSHVAFSQGRLGGPEYDVEKGAFIDGAWIFPGQLINCRCVSRAVVEGL